MNLSDLKNFDIQTLQNIDTNDIVDFLKTNISVMISVGVIFLTVFLVVVILNLNGIKSKNLKNEFSELQEKFTAVSEADIIKQEYESFIAQLPKSVEGNDLRNVISQLAVSKDIQIMEYAPLGKKEGELVDLSQVRITILSRTYNNIVDFTKAIESMPYAIRIEKWSGQTKEAVFKGKAEGSMDVPIQATIEIGALKIKND